MLDSSSFFRERLNQELVARCDRNPRYSVRAFAKALALDAGTLSRILNGKQIPSFKLSQRIVDSLALSPQERDYFFSSVAMIQRGRQLKRLSHSVNAYPEIKPVKDLSLDLYRIISDWYHFAILELTFVNDFESDPSWIANQMGISETEAKLAIERLLQFQLLQRRKNGKLFKTDAQLSSADKHLTTAAHRKNQKQFLEKAIDSLENDPIEERSMTSMTMAINPEQLPLAKKMIREFNQKLCETLEKGSRERVYNLEVALYPLQKKVNRK